MFLVLLLLLIPFLIFLDYSNKKRRYELTANIPGPTIYPIIGSTALFKDNTVKDDMKFVQDLFKKYGSTVRVWILNTLIILLTDPKDIEIILSSPKYITKGDFYDFIKIWLGNGLLLSNGSKWLTRRKIITPTFHFKILENFVEVFEQQSEVLVEQLKSHCGKGSFDVFPYINLAALDIICETAMGTTINAQTNKDNSYVTAVSDITGILSDRFVNTFHQNNLIFSILASKKKQRQDECVKILHNFTEKIIAERRALLKKNCNNSEQQNVNEEDDTGTKKRMALLDLLLQSTINGEPLSNEDIREEVDTFMFGGHDTTTATISFCLFALSRHPEVQRKLFEEIQNVLGDEPVTYRNLQDLKYLECVIKETLRFYPTVPAIGRRMMEDVKLSNGKMLPAGAEIGIQIEIMMKNPEIFPEPEKFIPERHSAENLTTKNAYAYIPFSAGPRNCIGQKFAMLEMKTTISKILKHYELLPMGSEPDIINNIVSKSLNGVNIGIKERLN